MKEGAAMSPQMPDMMGFILLLSCGQGQASAGECPSPPPRPPLTPSLQRHFPDTPYGIEHETSHSVVRNLITSQN